MSSMSVGAWGSVAAYTSTSQQQTSTDKAMAALGVALKASNLSVAKEKAAALQLSLQSDLVSNSPSSASSRALRALSDNLNLVSKAMTDGDLRTAQTAYGKLKGNYASFRSLLTVPTPATSLTTSLISQLFGKSSSRSAREFASTSENIAKVISAYASYSYYLANNGTIQQSNPTVSTYSATA